MNESFKTSQSVQVSSQTPTLSHSTLNLYSCSLNEQPERNDDFGVVKEGCIRVQFDNVSRSQLKPKYNSRLDKTVYHYEYEVAVNFRSEEGVLTVKSFAYGNEAGTASITFHRQ